MTQTEAMAKARALLELCPMEEPEERALVRQRMRQLLDSCVARSLDPETVVREVLLEMGAPDHLMGHEYTVRAVLLALEDPVYIRCITFRLYPQVAAKFDTTANRVERAIRHLVDTVWTRGDWDVLRRYFGNTIHPDRGRPTNSEFLARLVNIVKQRLREG